MRRLLVLSLVLASAPTLAQDEHIGPYVGFGIGQLDLGHTVYRIDFDGTASTYKFTGGIRLNDLVAFEGYISQSQDLSINQSGFLFPFTTSTGPVGRDFTARMTGDYRVIEGRVMVHGSHVLGGLGYYQGDLTANVTGVSDFGPFATSGSESDSGIAVIIGAQWRVNRITIRAEYEHFDKGSPVTASNLGVQFQYGFRPSGE